MVRLVSTMVAEAQHQDDEDGVVLTPEEEEEFDAMIAETDADFAAGRFITFDEMRERLRRWREAP